MDVLSGGAGRRRRGRVPACTVPATAAGTRGSALIVVAAAGLAAIVALVVAVGLAVGGSRPAAAGAVDPFTPARDRDEPVRTVAVLGATDLADESGRAAGPSPPVRCTDPCVAGETGAPVASAGDGGALAWWIGTSVVVLLTGVAAVAAVTSRRRTGRRPPPDLVVVTAGPEPRPRPPATPTRSRPGSRSAPPLRAASPGGPLATEGAHAPDERHSRPIRVRL
jgi:hypothetical protein